MSILANHRQVDQITTTSQATSTSRTSPRAETCDMFKLTVNLDFESDVDTNSEYDPFFRYAFHHNKINDKRNLM